MNNRVFFIVICILAIASFIGFKTYLSVYSDKGEEVKVSDFPKTIGGWQGRDIPLTENEYQILETRNLIMRQYINSLGDSVYLYIVYSQDNRKVSHPPEICYMGSGSSIVEKKQIKLSDSIYANKMLIESKNKSSQLVVYWYKAANSNTDKYLKQQLKVALAHTLGKKISGALIRISTEMANNGEEQALNRLKSFCQEIEPLIVKYVP